MKIVDLNCDMGESFGAYQLGNDQEILSSITSANVACGFHAGDPATMRKTVQMALEAGVAIGAHPGFADLVGFGRRNMEISPEEAYDLVVYQIGALQAFVRAEGGVMHHVKPHGALYNMAATRSALAESIALAIYKVNPELVLYGLAGSELTRAGEKIGLATAHEVFADRTYQQDGTLTPRSQPNAMITDQQQSLQQVIRMVSEGLVLTQQGVDIPIQADSICIHGDGAHALEFAQSIRAALSGAGITIAARFAR
ncbi:LamB/YcsF family protein [Brevibacillus sp. BC25]|uniref:LamB/YcsF family protein n=1 Tax=Brevibacillus sp. BC25 TaxID=1144308 RepID=UPI000271290C|nr:5-oxoprolinase subunit PxpA [Brevibacillus sp. BC25]EJL28487.1 putative lactam utilization protein B-like protein [Brevibacillus sp. BC25]